MKMRLTLVEIDEFNRLRKENKTTRKHEVVKTVNLPSDRYITGLVISIRGTEYMVIEQAPSRKATNAARKSMNHQRFAKWLIGGA